jgi:hypothetical protein
MKTKGHCTFTPVTFPRCPEKEKVSYGTEFRCKKIKNLRRSTLAWIGNERRKLEENTLSLRQNKTFFFQNYNQHHHRLETYRNFGSFARCKSFRKLWVWNWKEIKYTCLAQGVRLNDFVNV